MALAVANSRLGIGQEQRLRRLVTTHFQFAWRTLRRLGVPEADLDDAAQRVFSVVADKLPTIEVDLEKSFVFGTALRVASHARRARQRRREAPLEQAGELYEQSPDPEVTLQRNEAVEQLAAILEAMEESVRAVFVLFELEQLTMAEIAKLQQLPPGTVASRLRRGREQFQGAIAALQSSSEARHE